MNKKLYLPFILFLLIISVFFIGLKNISNGEDPKSLESVLIGKPVPTSNFTDLWSEKQFNAHLFQQGKPILLNVWATWCPTCYAEHQYLNELSKQGIIIIGVNYKDSADKAIKWLKELNNPYQAVISDPQGVLGLDLGVYGAPETFIVDGKGIIHYRHTGDINQTVWQKTLKPIYDRLMEQQ